MCVRDVYVHFAPQIHRASLLMTVSHFTRTRQMSKWTCSPHADAALLLFGMVSAARSVYTSAHGSPPISKTIHCMDRSSAGECACCIQ